MPATPRLPRRASSRPMRWPRSLKPGNRLFMVRIILFLGLIALAAAGAAWIADQSGEGVLSWGGWRVETTVPVFALALGVTIVAAVTVWSILRGLWRTPERIRRKRRERRRARGRPAITPRPPRGRPGRSPRPPPARRRGAASCRA